MTERDLDLIQLEELHANNGYADWFAEKIGLACWTFESSQHLVTREVNGSIGESDAFVIYKQDKQRCSVLIEDKVAAAFGDRQAERYQERGEALVAEGDVESFRTVLVAPRQYLDVVPADAPWHVQVAVEDIAAWFDAQDGHHAKWRSQALRQMLQRVERSASPDREDVARFSREFSEYLARQHGSHLRHNPGQDPSGPTIKFTGAGRSRKIWWKFSTSQMVLELSPPYVGLDGQIKLPPSLQFERASDYNRKKDCVVAEVPPVDPSQPIDKQIDVIEAAVEAAEMILSIVPQLDKALERSSNPSVPLANPRE